MLKIPRFLKEYANFKKKELSENKLLDKRTVEEWIDTIDNTLRLYPLDLMSLTEAMDYIGHGEYIGS